MTRETTGMLEQYFRSLLDKDVPEPLRPILAGWRRLAHELGYSWRVVWRTRPGFNLYTYLPQAFPGFQRQEPLQDASTEDAHVFCIPRIVPDSWKGNRAAQLQLLKTLQRRHDLPVRHLSTFGSASLLGGLLLSYAAEEREALPLGEKKIQTDTRSSSDNNQPLALMQDERGVECNLWLDDAQHERYGCIPIGIEPVVGETPATGG